MSKSYEIDQSNKIEQTERDTVLACSQNKKSFTIKLKRQDKRLLQEIFKNTGKTKFFPYLMFSVLVALLIKEVKPQSSVIIDQEYTGHDDLIRERVISYLKALNVKQIPEIKFGHVGKLSYAHSAAADITVRGKKSNKTAKLEEVLELIFNTKKDRELKRALS